LNKSRLTANEQILSSIKENDYANAAKLLLQMQVNEWDKLDEGYKSLSSLKTKSFWFNGFKIKVQFNAGRIFSTSAKVDVDSIKNRSCFLCEKNLPAEQKGIKLLAILILFSLNILQLLPQITNCRKYHLRSVILFYSRNCFRITTH